MKTCTKCDQEKPLTEFHNCKSKPGGKFSACKECRNAANRARSEEIGYDVLYRRNKERDVDLWREKNRAKYLKNADSIKRRTRIWAEENPEAKKLSRKKHYDDNKDVYIESAARWARENPEKRKKAACDYSRRERSTPEGKARQASRRMLARVIGLTGRSKLTKTETAIGFTRKELVDHIAHLFHDGMTWDNYGEWHIDHVVPLSELVRLGITDPKEINKLSNLQPLWASRNMEKRDKFELSMSNFKI